MTFLGWELPTGEIVNRYQTGEDAEGKPIYAYPAQHQANELRDALNLGRKTKMKPRY